MTRLPGQGPREPEGAVSSGASVGQGLVQPQPQAAKQLGKGSTSSVSAARPLQAMGRRWAHSWSFLEKPSSSQWYPETGSLGAGRMVSLWKEFLTWVSSLMRRLSLGRFALGADLAWAPRKGHEFGTSSVYTKRFEDSWSRRQHRLLSQLSKLQQES